MAALVDMLTQDDLPRRIDKERGVNLLFKLFLPFLDDYLYEEQNYVKTTCQELIDEWVRIAMAQQYNNWRLTDGSWSSEQQFGCAER